ncbi:uncharacterized protein LOC129768176 [Toxorhynchites rutilus septentrionalis]|uniref:uncharacterized protein LOC129768176 n=1 Tax=Toxorhynchites rutilus septentrionalis TaxID=329112 RepID=UPI002478D25C|nr:uncharacterized protein LOC129768176 [Toxorhynchites rutilus septentrionalis]XP_055625619.1 uncharacterized protein LOC129768176 [Toxorhynchites rutilus septentrionalis]
MNSTKSARAPRPSKLRGQLQHYKCEKTSFYVRNEDAVKSSKWLSQWLIRKASRTEGGPADITNNPLLDRTDKQVTTGKEGYQHTNVTTLNASSNKHSLVPASECQQSFFRLVPPTRRLVPFAIKARTQNRSRKKRAQQIRMFPVDSINNGARAVGASLSRSSDV